MELVAAGPGVTLEPWVEEPPVLTVVPDEPEPEPEPEQVYVPEPLPAPVVQPEVVYQPDQITALREEMNTRLADIEFRLAQEYELKLRNATGQMTKVYAEDISEAKHRITGFTLTSNTPAGTGISWSTVHLVFQGVDYTITDGVSVTSKYAWFVKPGSYTPGTNFPLTVGNTLPVLGVNDALVFTNQAGVATSVLTATIAPAVANGTVSSASMDAAMTAQLAQMQSDLLSAQATADGSITTYFQPTRPWPDGDATAGGATNPAAKVGDVWYDSVLGGAYRWSGAGGTPANTWVRIADTDSAAMTQKVNSKITTYVKPSTTPPTPNPPDAQFTEGDLWMVTDQNNKFRRWTTGAWSDYILGDAALSGIAGGKVGTGISASNVTTGSLAGSLVGTGVSATNVTTGTLAGGLVGTGVSATNVTTGVLAGSLVGTGINGTNVTTGTVPGARVGTGVTGVNLASATGTILPTNVNAAFHIIF
jgi:hypothetical protein